MKLKQILEGPPDFLDKEMPDVKTSSTIRFYSQATIDREFDVLGQSKSGSEEYWSIISKDRTFAVIGRVGVRKSDMSGGIYMLGTLDFKDKPDLASNRWIETSKVALQVDSVVVHDQKFNGVGYELYKAIVNYGFVLISDHTQYRGGKALWQKIVRLALADHLAVYVVDDGNPILDDNGKPLKYDGKNIPDDKIWNAPTHGSGSRYFTLLILRKDNL